MEPQPVRDFLQKYVAGTPASAHPVRRAAFAEEVRSIDEANRTIVFAASTEDEDRYGDVIRANGWQTKNYMRNPVFLFAHDSSQPPIGKCVQLTIEKGPKPALVQKIQFADKATYPFADTIFNLYKGGFMNAVSVGFRPLEQPTPITDSAGNRTGGYEFTSQELYELSAVPIPANPAALARAFESGIVTREFAAKVFAEEKESAVQIVVHREGANEIAFAREILIMRAAKSGLRPIQVSDEETMLRARSIVLLGELDRALGVIQSLLPLMDPEAVAEFVERFDAQEFEEALFKPEISTLEGFFEALEN